MTAIQTWQNWIKETLIAVAGMDEDYARESNDVGFSKFDGGIGHSLADQLRADKFLSPAQWKVAGQLATRYKRQARNPMPPKPNEVELFEALELQKIQHQAKVLAECYVRILLVDGSLQTEQKGRVPKDLFFSITSLLKSLGFKFPPATTSWALSGRKIDDGPGVAKCLNSQPGIRLDAGAESFLHALAPVVVPGEFKPVYPPTLFPYQVEGIEWLHRQKTAILGDQMGLGKEQPCREPVLTPTGWRELGDLKVGDYVVAHDGKPTKVTGVYPQGLKPVYKIQSNDGSWTLAGEEHLWEVTTPDRKFRNAPPRVMTTNQLRAEGLQIKNGNNKFFLPICSPIQYVSQTTPLPIPPYTLGVLLGDGTCKRVTANFCKGDEELAVLVADDLGSDWEVRRLRNKKVPTWSICRTNREGRGFSTKLESLGLKVGSLEKFIPERYLRASEGERWDLLQGLLDTDSYVNDTLIEFSTSSPRLAADIVDLVQGLGGVGYTAERATASGNLGWRVNISVGKGISPFRRQAKHNAFIPKTKYEPTRPITAITYVGVMECVCIMVDNPRHLYVTRNHIVTHNTVQVLCSLDSSFPVLIVAPKAAKAVWIREANHWRPDITILQINKPKDFRFPKAGEVLVCNYEQFPKLKTEDPANTATMESKLAYELTPGTVLVADEAQNLKNTKANRSRRYRVMAKAILETHGKVWNLSGTPILNRQQELWGILSSMCSERIIFPSGWKQFVHECDGRDGRWGMEWGTRIDPAVGMKLKTLMLRRTRSDVFSQTPAKIREFYPVEISKAFRAQLDALWVTMGDAPEDPETFLDKVMTKGIAFEEVSKLRRELAEIKTAALLELVEEAEENGEPICVASAHRLPIDLLGKRKGWASITGDTSADERGRIQDKFQAGELKGVAFTIKAGGVGISLHKGTNRMIFVDLEWTPALNAQAEDRLRPHLQKQSCLYTILQINHKLEQRINTALVYKAELIEKFYKGEGA